MNDLHYLSREALDNTTYILLQVFWFGRTSTSFSLLQNNVQKIVEKRFVQDHGSRFLLVSEVPDADQLSHLPVTICCSPMPYLSRTVMGMAHFSAIDHS